MARDERHERQTEIARKVLIGEGKDMNFRDYWDRQTDIKDKCIELFGEYQHGGGIIEVSPKDDWDDW